MENATAAGSSQSNISRLLHLKKQQQQQQPSHRKSKRNQINEKGNICTKKKQTVRNVLLDDGNKK